MADLKLWFWRSSGLLIQSRDAQLLVRRFLRVAAVLSSPLEATSLNMLQHAKSIAAG
jgi:hypothetical protein